VSAKTFSLICASLSLAAVALPISINERNKVDKYRRQRQAEIQRAADDAAEEAYRKSPAGQRELEENLEWSKKNQPEMYLPYYRAWENFSKQLHRQMEEEEARHKRDDAKFQKDMEAFKDSRILPHLKTSVGRHYEQS